MIEILITPEHLETLDNLFEINKRISIETAEDYQKLGEIFDEEE